MQSEADTQPCNGCEIAYPGQMVLTAHAKVSARLNHCENAPKKNRLTPMSVMPTTFQT